MTRLNELYQRMIQGMNAEGLEIPVTAIKFYKQEDEIPEAVLACEVEDLSITACQANKQASLGDSVLLTKKNIGCIAAGITFGLIDQNQQEFLSGSRVYTDIMKEQSEDKEGFKPPSPKDFTDGIVYACKDSKRPDFCLFGSADAGRFKDVETAKKAIKEMVAIQPATIKAVFLFSLDFDDVEVIPDVVVLSVRPVELTRIAQAYHYLTGERVYGSMGPVRAVDSDLIVKPYIDQKINFASYCLGARLIAQYEPSRLGMGIPMKDFDTIVQGIEDSQTGYPYQNYPGAVETTV